ncbi:MAG: helix-turn-helix domain-containing protein [Halanaerobiales bacterium]|nr:helix-turn-helix domain-containing protein [Halanaerobiales bacterium]
MTFSKRLKYLRKESDLYQKELAEKIGVSRTTITQYENGAREPNYEILKKLANFFEVSTDYLLGNTDQRRPAGKMETALIEDQKLLEIYESLKHRKDLRMMFKETKELNPSTVKQIIEIIKTFKKNNV